MQANPTQCKYSTRHQSRDWNPSPLLQRLDCYILVPRYYLQPVPLLRYLHAPRNSTKCSRRWKLEAIKDLSYAVFNNCIPRELHYPKEQSQGSTSKSTSLLGSVVGLQQCNCNLLTISVLHDTHMPPSIPFFSLH